MAGSWALPTAAKIRNPPGIIVEAHLNTPQLRHLGEAGTGNRNGGLLLVRNGDLMWVPGFYTRNQTTPYIN